MTALLRVFETLADVTRRKPPTNDRVFAIVRDLGHRFTDAEGKAALAGARMTRSRGRAPGPPLDSRTDAPGSPDVAPATRGRARITKESLSVISDVLPGLIQETPSLGAPTKKERKPNPPWALAEWFRAQALERDLIPAHKRSEAATATAIRADLAAAAGLIEAGYESAEIAARARRFLDAIRDRVLERSRPTVRSFAEAWDFACVARPTLAAVPDVARPGAVVNRPLR